MNQKETISGHPQTDARIFLEKQPPIKPPLHTKLQTDLVLVNTVPVFFSSTIKEKGLRYALYAHVIKQQVPVNGFLCKHANLHSSQLHKL